MKRLMMIAWTLGMVMAAVSTPVFSEAPTITAEVDEQQTELYTVDITMDDQYLASDVPPVLFDYQGQYRTLVPVAVIARQTGAEVTWDGENREVAIQKGQNEIVLTIDSAEVVVNGDTQVLPSQVPAKIITYQDRGRTMVPVAFLGNELGMRVGWDDATRTVQLTSPEEEEPEPDAPPEETAGDTDHHEEVPEDPETADTLQLKDIDISMRGGIPEIRLQSGGEADYSTARLTNPDRLVFDLKQTSLRMNDEDKMRPDQTVRVDAPENSFLSAVRSSQFEVDPNVVRLVLDLKSDAGHQVSYDEDSEEMVIRLLNYVDDVRVERFNAREVIAIEGNDVSDYQIMHLNSPHRLVIDVKESKLNPGRYILNRSIDGRVVEGVRIAEFEPDDHYDPEDSIVRVAVDLNKEIDQEDLYIQEEAGQLMVHLEGEPEEGYRYEETGWTTSRLTFTGSDTTDYRVEEEADGELLKLFMPRNNMDIPFDVLDVNDDLVEYVQISDTSDADELVANVHLKPGVEWKDRGMSNVQDLSVEFTNRDLKYREKLVVIDPGHGGRDPGAIAPNLKYTEKEVVLEVAREARRLLEEAGFRIYMTRSDDTYVSLEDRAGIANQLNADAFISIHSNAAGRSDLKGVETLYYPSERNNQDFRDNRFLAEVFQEEMVRTLGAASHRINARERLVVLRETKMPAVITELGFKTNPEEERLLATSEYRRRAAEGIKRSVIRYFEER